MLLFLTGAQTSLAKSEDNPQTDPSRSLGGYISSSPVPNSALNSLFDTVSAYTIEKKGKETIAIALINKLPNTVKNIQLKFVTPPDAVATFKVAAVSVNPETYVMETIVNRYQEPINATFHNASFSRVSVDMEITQYGSIGEEIMLYPFNIPVEIEECGWDGTWEAFEKAFESSDEYTIERLAERKYRISRRDNAVWEEGQECSYITTEGFSAKFNGLLQNQGADNTVLIAEDLAPEGAIGLWIQRQVKSTSQKSNKQLIKDYKERVIPETVEKIEMVIDYEIENMEE